MQDEKDKSGIRNIVLKAILQGHMEKKKREFETRRDELRRAHENQLEEKRIEANMEIAQKNRQQQEKLAMEAAKNQLKIALFNAEMQLKLSSINAKNQKELARFNAEAQQELARFNARNRMEHSINMAELSYNLESFPLYIRSWSSKNLLQNAEFLPVKIVVIPPEEGKGGWEEFLTAQITNFMQKNIPRTYYEFLGGAWRGGRCTGQTAYKMIYEEFHDEPFLIVDCNLLDAYRFNLRICFWYPESAGIQDRQLINDWDIRSALRLPPDNKYECMKLCAALCELTISLIVDTYQLAIGVVHHSEILKRLPQMLKEFSMLANKDFYVELARGILSEYRSLVQNEFSLDSVTRLHCTCELANAIFEMKKQGIVRFPGIYSEIEAYVKSAWEQWCGLMGISVDELWGILQSESDMEALRNILQEDNAAMIELTEIYRLYNKVSNSNMQMIQLVKMMHINEEARYGIEMQ